MNLLDMASKIPGLDKIEGVEKIMEKFNGVDKEKLLNSPEGKKIEKEGRENRAGMLESFFDSNFFEGVKGIVSWVSPGWGKKLDRLSSWTKIGEDIKTNIFDKGEKGIKPIWDAVVENANSPKEIQELMSGVIDFVPDGTPFKSTLNSAIEGINKIKPLLDYLPDGFWANKKKDMIEPDGKVVDMKKRLEKMIKEYSPKKAA